MARTTINSLGIPADTIVSADLDYPLTDFSSTGIDDNATGTALTIDSSGNISVTGTVDGRDLATDGAKLDNIEESADVTDTANVTAAGALMDSELTDLAGVKGVTISTLQPKPSEGAFIDGDKTKLDGIAASATNYGDSDVATYISGNRTYGNITTTGYIAGPSTFTIDPAAVGDNTGTLVIAGNLQVDGTTTTINSTTVDVDDLNIQLATGAVNAAAADGAGITVDGPIVPAKITYNSTPDEWTFNKNVRINIGTSTSAVNELSFTNAFDTAFLRSSYTNPSSTTETYLAFHTNTSGAVNNTVAEQMRIKGNKVGIGTTVPIRTLTINQTPPTTLGSPMLQVGEATFVASGYYGIGLGYTSTSYSNPPTEIAAVSTSSSGGTTADLVFATRNVTTDTAPTARMQISSDGYVGVGVAPSATVGRFRIGDNNSDINMDASAKGQFHIDGNGYGFGIALNTDGAQIYHNSLSRSLILGTDETERLRITGPGYVGIGTGVPAHRLSVAETNTTAGNRQTPVNVLGIQAQYAGNDGQPFGSAGSTSFGSGLVFTNEKYSNTSITQSAAIYGLVSENSTDTTGGGQLAFYTASTLDATLTEKMRILPNGNVGINEVNPQKKLSVVGGILAATGTGSTSGIIIDSTATAGYVSTITHTDTGMEFDTGAITRHFEFDGAGTNLWTLYTNTGNINQMYGSYRFAATSSGSDTGSQFQLWGTNGGPGYMAAYTLNFNTGGNNSRTTTMSIDNNGKISVANGLGFLDDEGGDSFVLYGGTTNGSGLLLHGNAAKILPVRNGASINATIDLGQDSRRFKDLYLYGRNYITDGTRTMTMGCWASQPRIETTNGTLVIHSFGAYDTTIQTNSTERLRINASGQIFTGPSSSIASSASSSAGTITAGSTFGSMVAGSAGGGGTFGSNLTLTSGNAPRIAHSHSTGYGASGVYFSWGSTYFYNTSGNVTTGGAPDLSMDIRQGGGNSTISNEIRHYDRSGNTIKRDRIYRFVTTTAAASAHMKTNISWASHTQMYSIHFEGQEYQASRAIDSTLSWYSYSPSNAAINIGSYGTHSATVYSSSDGYLVMRLDYNSTAYYSAFTVSLRTTAQNINASFEITASTQGTTANQY